MHQPMNNYHDTHSEFSGRHEEEQIEDNVSVQHAIRRPFNDPLVDQQQRMQEEQDRLKQLMITICTYLEEKYQEQVKKIVMERDPELHYDVNVDLLEFLYHFPYEGSRFHEYPKEFIKFIKKCLVAVQSKIIAGEEAHIK